MKKKNKMRTGIFDNYIIKLDYHKNRKDNNMKTFDNITWRVADARLESEYHSRSHEIVANISGYIHGPLHNIVINDMPKLIESKLNSPITSDHDEYIRNDVITTPQSMIKDVIFNDPATIVYWADGTKTVVKAQDDEFDPEKGLAMAFSKKLFGNKGNYYNVFRQWLEPYWQKKAEEADAEIANLWRMLMDATTSVADKLNAYAQQMREEVKNDEESIEDAAKKKYNPVEEAYMQINNFLNGNGSLDLDEIRGLLGEALE